MSHNTLTQPHPKHMTLAIPHHTNTPEFPQTDFGINQIYNLNYSVKRSDHSTTDHIILTPHNTEINTNQWTPISTPNKIPDVISNTPGSCHRLHHDVLTTTPTTTGHTDETPSNLLCLHGNTNFGLLTSCLTTHTHDSYLNNSNNENKTNSMDGTLNNCGKNKIDTECMTQEDCAHLSSNHQYLPDKYSNQSKIVKPTVEFGTRPR